MKRVRFERAMIAAAAAGLLASTSAPAGMIQDQAVTIDDADHSATGSLGFVHNSSDRVQYIGCRLGFNLGGRCFARNTAGVTQACFTRDPEIMATIGALNGDSYLTFKWDQNGACTAVYVSIESFSVSKNPSIIP